MSIIGKGGHPVGISGSSTPVTRGTPAAPAPGAPTVTIARPAADAIVSGSSVTLDAVPHTTGTITGVQFLWGLNVIGSGTLTNFGWITTWDTTSVPNGKHLLTAIATDSLSQTGQLTISVTVNNSVASGITLPIQGNSPSTYIDNTDTHESTAGINAWIAANTNPGDTIKIPAGTYWIDGTINLTGGRTLTAADTGNKPVFHRHTTYPWRVSADTRSTVNGVSNPAYNPNGRAGTWQFDQLGGEASIPTSQGNPYASDTPALGATNGGYDAKVTRSGNSIIGLTALYGSPWSSADVGKHGVYLVESGGNGSNSFIVQSVASDGKSLTFATPFTKSAATAEGSEGTVTWCITVSGGGWKVAHQTNDTLSFWITPNVAHPWQPYQNAISAAVNAAMNPIVLFTDASASTLDNIVLQHANAGWHSAITNFEKSYPLVTEFARCVESQSANQTISNCELSYPWGAGEHGPAQLLNCLIHHTGMQACTAHWDNKLIDGGTFTYTHHSIIDIEDTTTRHNVTIQNLNVGNPADGQGFMSYAPKSNVVNFTLKNINSTSALKTAGTIPDLCDMWASNGAKGYTGAGTNHLITGCEFDTSNHLTDPAMQITNVTNLTVTNNKIPTWDVFVRYGSSTNVTSTGNDGGNGVPSTTQKAS